MWPAVPYRRRHIDQANRSVVSLHRAVAQFAIGDSKRMGGNGHVLPIAIGLAHLGDVPEEIRVDTQQRSFSSVNLDG